MATFSARCLFVAKNREGSIGIESDTGRIEKGLVTYGNGGDVREVSGDTGSVDDIVEGKLVNQRGSLEQEREGLEQRDG